MEEILPKKPLPADVTEYLYRVALWVEDYKIKKPIIKKWKKGVKSLTRIDFAKISNKMLIPSQLPQDAIYIPSSYSSVDVLRQIRHAFCHNQMSYNIKSGQIIVNKEVFR